MMTNADILPVDFFRSIDFDFVLRRDTIVDTAPEAPRRHHRNTSVGSTAAYSIAAQKAAYGIPVDLQASNDETLQMV